MERGVVGCLHFSGIRTHVGESIKNVGQFVSRDILRVVVASVDRLETLVWSAAISRELWPQTHVRMWRWQQAHPIDEVSDRLHGRHGELGRVVGSGDRSRRAARLQGNQSWVGSQVTEGEEDHHAQQDNVMNKGRNRHREGQ